MIYWALTMCQETLSCYKGSKNIPILHPTINPEVWSAHLTIFLLSIPLYWYICKTPVQKALGNWTIPKVWYSKIVLIKRYHGETHSSYLPGSKLPEGNCLLDTGWHLLQVWPFLSVHSHGLSPKDLVLPLANDPRIHFPQTPTHGIWKGADREDRWWPRTQPVCKDHQTVELHRNQYLGRRKAAQPGGVGAELCSGYKGWRAERCKISTNRRKAKLLVPVIGSCWGSKKAISPDRRAVFLFNFFKICPQTRLPNTGNCFLSACF